MIHFDIRVSFFIIELMLATALFSRHCHWRKGPRFLAIPLVIVLFGLSPERSLSTLNGDIGRLPIVLAYYAVCAFVVVLLVRWLTDTAWLGALVMTTAGYAVQHVAYDALTVLLIICGWGDDTGFYFTVEYYALYLSVYLAVYLLFWVLFGRRYEVDVDKVHNRLAWVMGDMALLVLVIVFNLVFVVNLPARQKMVCLLYDGICTVLGLVMLQLVSTNNRLADDLRIMHQVNRLQTRHYEMAKENIDIINIKCHDIRKNLASLYADDTERPSAESIREVEQSVRIYDAMFHTGNESLDVLLSEKSLLCEKRGVKLTCVADGKALDFMDLSDLYALFGNILDNAMEAVSALADEDQRVISLRVQASGGLLNIEEQNYYQGSLRLNDDGLPITTKADKRLHGLGMRSIVYQIHKYGGEFHISTADHIFSLSIVIPLS